MSDTTEQLHTLVRDLTAETLGLFRRATVVDRPDSRELFEMAKHKRAILEQLWTAVTIAARESHE